MAPCACWSCCIFTASASPFELATLFLLYEAMGVVTNFLGGWIGARFGLRVTLSPAGGAGFALLMLSATDPAWTVAGSVAYVMVAQALSGVAKDLTKMSSKSAVKLVSDGEVNCSLGGPADRFEKRPQRCWLFHRRRLLSGWVCGCAMGYGRHVGGGLALC